MTAKIPTAFQALFGFALVVVGAYTMMQSSVLAQGNLVTLLMLALIGVLYLVHGFPSLIEGVMTMNAEYEERKRLLNNAPPAKK